MRKEKGTAYLLWLAGIFGWLGFHHLYLGKPVKASIWMLTFGLGFLGSLMDLFLLGDQVETANADRQRERSLLQL